MNRLWPFSTEAAARPGVAAAKQRLHTPHPPVELHRHVEADISIRRISDLFEQHDVPFRSANRLGGLPLWVPDAAPKMGKPWLGCHHNGPAINRYAFAPRPTGDYEGLRESEFSRPTSAGRGDTCSDRAPDSNTAVEPSATIARNLATHESIRMVADKHPQTVKRAVRQAPYRFDKSPAIEAPNERYRCDGIQRQGME